MRRPSFFCLLVEILLVLPPGRLWGLLIRQRQAGPVLPAHADTHMSPDRMENLPDLLQRIITSAAPAAPEVLDGSDTRDEDWSRNSLKQVTRLSDPGRNMT